MSADRAQTLRELSTRFERPARSREEGLRVLELARRLNTAASEHEELPPEGIQQLRWLVLEVAAALSRFTPAAVAALSLPAATADLKAFIGTAYQVAAGCFVLHICGQLAGHLRLADQDAFRLTAAVQLVFAAGPLPRATLRQLRQLHCQSAAEQPKTGATRSAGTAPALRQREWEEDLRWAEADPACTSCWLQVWAASAACCVLEQQHPQVAAALARSTARPAAVLPWLRTASEALLQPQNGPPEGLAFELGVSYVSLICALVQERCWSQHADGIAADPTLTAAVAEVLLTQGLPALAAGAAGEQQQQLQTGRLAWALTQLVGNETLCGACSQLLEQPDASSRIAAALGSVLAALPAQPTAGAAHCGQLARMYMPVSALSLTLCRLAVRPNLAELANALDSVTSAVNGSCSSGAAGEGAGTAVCDHSSSIDAGASSVSQGATRAAWVQLAVQAASKFASALRKVAGPDGPAVSGPASNAAHCAALAATCANTSNLLSVWLGLDGQPVSAVTNATWVEAAVAGLRLQPLLGRLDAAFQLRLDGSLQQAARRLSQQLLLALTDGMPPYSGKLDGATQEAAASALPQLLQLHNLTCRLCHWLAGGAVLAGDETLTRAHWKGLLCGLDKQLYAALDTCALVRGSQLGELREAWALSVAHLAAVQAVTAAAADARVADGYPDCRLGVVAGMTESLLAVAEACSAIVTGAFLQPVQAAAVALPQGDTQLYHLAWLLTRLAGACAAQPRLACSLASTGLLAMALDCAGQLAACSDDSAEEQAGPLLDSCARCLEALVAARQLVGSDAGSELAVEATEAVSCLQERRAALLLDDPEPQLPSERAQHLRQLLPAAERVAAAFDAYCQLPSQQAAVQLEVARAAAPRRCSYLRCANMQAEGGAVMYKGDRGQRCSACRMAWYCGTGCSHADWREGGHRRVCKLLGQERQRRKAAEAHAHEQ